MIVAVNCRLLLEKATNFDSILHSNERGKHESLGNSLYIRAEAEAQQQLRQKVDVLAFPSCTLTWKCQCPSKWTRIVKLLRFISKNMCMWCTRVYNVGNLEMNSSVAVECQEFYGTPQLAERTVSDLGNAVFGG